MKRRKKQKPLYYTQFFWKIHEVFTLSGCVRQPAPPEREPSKNPPRPSGELSHRDGEGKLRALRQKSQFFSEVFCNQSFFPVNHH